MLGFIRLPDDEVRENDKALYLSGTCEGIEQALKHRGGLRAQIVSGGMIRVGDAIVASPGTADT